MDPAAPCSPNTMFNTVCPLPLSTARSIQSTPSKTIYERSILTSSAHLRQSFQRSQSFRFPHQNTVHILFFTSSLCLPKQYPAISTNSQALYHATFANLPHQIHATHTQPLTWPRREASSAPQFQSAYQEPWSQVVAQHRLKSASPHQGAAEGAVPVQRDVTAVLS